MTNYTPTTGFIYGLRVVGSDKIQYVGLTTKTVAQRLAGHKKVSRAGGTFPSSRWIRKHGEDLIEAVTLEECELSVLPEREVFWIAKLGTLINTGGSGLNVTPGGYGISMDYVRTDKRVKSWSNRKALSESDVADIRDLYTSTPITISELHEIYPQVCRNVVSHVALNQGAYYDAEYIPPLGRRVDAAKRLMDSEVRAIRDMYVTQGVSGRDIAKEVGASTDQVYDILRNKSHIDPDYIPPEARINREYLPVTSEVRAKMSASQISRWEAMSDEEKAQNIQHLTSTEARERMSKNLKTRIEAGTVDPSALGKSRAVWTNHKRWHLDRAKPNPECTLCQEADPSDFILKEVVLIQQTPEWQAEARERVKVLNHNRWHAKRDLIKEGCELCEQ